MSCLQDCTFLNINLTIWRIFILYFENVTFGVIINWSDRIGSGQYFACYRLIWSGRVTDNKPVDISDFFASDNFDLCVKCSSYSSYTSLNCWRVLLRPLHGSN